MSTASRKPRLFLSHASEQKTEVVEPLDRLLSDDFDVWYDKKNIAPIGSLFKTIGDALTWCDYAVLIISPEFTQKEWTTREMRLAWSLEIERKRSVIIPVWYKLSKADLLEFAPFLVDVPAIVSTDPNRIAEGIKFAVGIGEQARTVLSPLGRKFREFQGTVETLERYRSWSISSDGFQAVHAEWDRVEMLAKQVLQQHNESRFQVSAGTGYGGMVRWIGVKGFSFTLNPNSIDGSRVLNLRFDLQGSSIPSMKCRRQIFFDPPALFFNRIPPEIADEFEFAPYCTGDGRPVWREASKPSFETETLVEKGFDKLLDIAHRLANGEPVRWWAMPT
jgi:hypothetical protein